MTPPPGSLERPIRSEEPTGAREPRWQSYRIPRERARHRPNGMNTWPREQAARTHISCRRGDGPTRRGRFDRHVRPACPEGIVSEPIEEFFERLTAWRSGSASSTCGRLSPDRPDVRDDDRTLVPHDAREETSPSPIATRRPTRDPDLQGPVRRHGHREGERDGRRAAWRRVARRRSHPAGAVPAGPAGAAATRRSRGSATTGGRS